MSHTSNPPLLAVHEITYPNRKEKEMTTTTKDLCWGIAIIAFAVVGWRPVCVLIGHLMGWL